MCVCVCVLKVLYLSLLQVTKSVKTIIVRSYIDCVLSVDYSGISVYYSDISVYYSDISVYYSGISVYYSDISVYYSDISVYYLFNRTHQMWKVVCGWRDVLIG